MKQQAQQVKLVAEKREVLGKKVKRLRRKGLIPAVIYGHDFDSVPIQFDVRELRRVLSQVGGSQLVNIEIKGVEQPEMALVRALQRDIITGDLLHVDFYRVDMTERLTAEIPLVPVGESPIAAQNEGILLYGADVIEVECLPGDLVDGIEVDLSTLTEVGHSLYVHDLAIPSSMELLTDPEEMVARVVPLAEEEVIEEIIEPTVEMPEAEEVELVAEAEEGEEIEGEEEAAEEEEEHRDYMM